MARHRPQLGFLRPMLRAMPTRCRRAAKIYWAVLAVLAVLADLRRRYWLLITRRLLSIICHPCYDPPLTKQQDEDRRKTGEWANGKEKGVGFMVYFVVVHPTSAQHLTILLFSVPMVFVTSIL